MYLITKHDHYYPGGGTADWVLLTSDEQHARTEFFTLALHEDEYAYLIQLDEDGWHILEIRP